MRLFGELCLLASLVGFGYAAFAFLIARHDRWKHLASIGVKSAIGSTLALTMTLVVLAWALGNKDFSFDYVAQYTSRLLPWHYSLSALWVGQAGSLLLWAWLLAALSMIFFVSARSHGPLATTSFGFLSAIICFVIAIMVFAADPMKSSLSLQSDGLGLSPLLQHPSMLIHPPVVFLSYAAWAVPCALAAAALCTGELDARWIQLARPWAVFAWTVLGAGLLLGAHWAYQELGWGGYWGWDPVENGSLLPWLTGTALIHSLMAWRHRGCLKKTAISLAIGTFGLCNFATFLTRSGIFSSVHAFSQSPIGWMFLGLMGVLLVGGGTLIFLRRGELSPQRQLGSIFSRESLVLFSACLLLLLTSVVLVGTLYVPLSTLFVGHMVQIGPAFYNNVLMAIGILLLASTAIVPLTRWGSAPSQSQKETLLLCALPAFFAPCLAAVLGWRHPVALAIIGLAALALCTTTAGLALDAWRHSTTRHLVGVLLMLRQRRRLYCGYAIHLAIACIAIGIAGSSLGTRRYDADLNEGDVVEWAGRRIEYLRLAQRDEKDKLIAEAELHVSRGGNSPVVLKPARHLHLLQDQWTTEVAIHSTWAADFYVILHAGLGNGQVALTFIENPLMRWIWLGGWLAGGSGLVAIWPARIKRTRQGGQLRHARQSIAIAPARRRAA